MTSAAPEDAPRRLRAGVIGLGWAGQQHVAAYAEDPTVDLVALSAMEEHLLAEFGERHQVPGRYQDWKEMLAEAELDVVSIATPTFLHATMAIAALEAGVHVMTEKPMAQTGEAAATMVEAARRAGRVLEVSFNHRQRGDVAALKSVIDTGVLGPVYYAKTGWIRRQGIPGMGTWFTKAASSGGGAMMDIGIHMLDMTLHLLGEPEVTAASASTHAEFGPRGRGGSGFGISQVESGAPFEVEDLATAFLRLEGGATMLLESSWAQWIPEDLCYVTLYGADGGATIEWGGGPGNHRTSMSRSRVSRPSASRSSPIARTSPLSITMSTECSRSVRSSAAATASALRSQESSTRASKLSARQPCCGPPPTLALCSTS